MPERIPVGSPPSEISVGRTCPKPTAASQRRRPRPVSATRRSRARSTSPPGLPLRRRSRRPRPAPGPAAESGGRASVVARGGPVLAHLHHRPHRPVVRAGIGEHRASDGAQRAAHEDVVDLAVGPPGGPGAAAHRPPPARHEQARRAAPRCSCPRPAPRRGGPPCCSWRRSSAKLRGEPKSRCDMWVPATEMGLPSTVRSTTSAARRRVSARRTRMCTRRVASIGSSGRTRTAMPHRPRLASCHRASAGRGPIAGARRPCRAPGCRSRQLGWAIQRVAGAGLGTDAAPLAQRVGHDLVAEHAGGLGRLTPFGVALGGPGLLEHDHVGIECGDGGEIVVGPAPPVHPAVHVVVGDAEHGPSRR